MRQLLFNNIFHICFRYNRLTCVPASLANCTNMDEFNVEGNNIAQLPVSRQYDFDLTNATIAEFAKLKMHSQIRLLLYVVKKVHCQTSQFN